MNVVQGDARMLPDGTWFDTRYARRRAESRSRPTRIAATRPPVGGWKRRQERQLAIRKCSARCGLGPQDGCEPYHAVPAAARGRSRGTGAGGGPAVPLGGAARPPHAASAPAAAPPPAPVVKPSGEIRGLDPNAPAGPEPSQAPLSPKQPPAAAAAAPVPPPAPPPVTAPQSPTAAASEGQVSAPPAQAFAPAPPTGQTPQSQAAGGRYPRPHRRPPRPHRPHRSRRLRRRRRSRPQPPRLLKRRPKRPRRHSVHLSSGRPGSARKSHQDRCAGRRAGQAAIPAAARHAERPRQSAQSDHRHARRPRAGRGVQPAHGTAGETPPEQRKALADVQKGTEESITAPKRTRRRSPIATKPTCARSSRRTKRRQARRLQHSGRQAHVADAALKGLARFTGLAASLPDEPDFVLRFKRAC